MNNQSANIIRKAFFVWGHRPSDLAHFWGVSKYTIDEILRGYEYQDDYSKRTVEEECFTCPLEKCIYEVSSWPGEKLKATCPAIKAKTLKNL